MPLIKKASKEALSQSMGMEEMPSNPKNLSVAYNVQRQARKKKMAMGGMATPTADEFMSGDFDSDMPGSIAEAIMMKKKKMMADGGEVDIQDNGQEMYSNPYDEDNELAVKKELYDDSQLMDQPMDSNEMGDDIDEDAHDMVSMIRKKIKTKV